MNYCVIKNYFLVFLGMENEGTKKAAVANLQQLGECSEIMQNSYILTVTSDKPVLINNIREAATLGKDIAMVIRLESETEASWRLKTEKSKLLDSIVEELNK